MANLIGGDAMPKTVTLDEAELNLRELLGTLPAGEEIVITHESVPWARLIGERPKAKRPPPGLGKGSILYMAPDFDAPLEEFKEYME